MPAELVAGPGVRAVTPHTCKRQSRTLGKDPDLGSEGAVPVPLCPTQVFQKSGPPLKNRAEYHSGGLNIRVQHSSPPTWQCDFGQLTPPLWTSVCLSKNAWHGTLQPRACQALYPGAAEPQAPTPASALSELPLPSENSSEPGEARGSPSRECWSRGYTGSGQSTGLPGPSDFPNRGKARPSPALVPWTAPATLGPGAWPSDPMCRPQSQRP